MEKAKDTNYLRQLKGEFQEVCQKNEISEEELKEILDDFFIFLRKAIKDFRVPTIQITNFGTFKPSLGKIRKHISRNYYHFNRGHIPREELVRRIKKIWPIRTRIIQEKVQKRPTWKLWRKKEKAATFWDPLYPPKIDKDSL